MKSLTVIAVGTLCLCFSQGALAEGLKALPYTGLQATFTQTSYDDVPEDGSGFALDGSLAIGSNVFISGAYESTKVDFDVFGTSGSITMSSISAGLGYRHALSSTVDLVPEVSVIDATGSFGGGFGTIPDEDDTGWSASVSLRALVTPRVELGGGISYVSLFDDSGTSFKAQAHYYPSRNFGVGLAYDISDDANTLGLSGRVLFGN